MKEYIVYFELYGKKMKAHIWAESEDGTKDELRNKIIFHKVVVANPGVNDTFNYLMNLFKMK